MFRVLLRPEGRKDEVRMGEEEEAVPSGCQPLSTQQQVWEIWKALLLMLSGSGLHWDEDEAEEAWGDTLL
ncbi:uncharacterized [Tachysurus ichikawai]